MDSKPWSPEWIDNHVAEAVGDHGIQDMRIGSPPLRAVFLAGAKAAFEEAEAVLWERVGREEYGHAKAAVTLDIEAIRARAAQIKEGDGGK